MTEKELSKRLSTFEGAYLSGLFMTNQSMVTAMSLLFEKIYLPNQLELVIELSKKYKIKTSIGEGLKTKFKRIDGENYILENPLEELTPSQQETAKQYLIAAHFFVMRNHALFPTVFETDLVENNEIFNVELVEKGKNGALNKFKVKPNELQLTKDGINELENRLKRGSVPLIGLGEFDLDTTKFDNIPDSSVAALIAMKSIELILPATKGVPPEIILETREKLSDHLPQFWSVMLKFSQEGKEIIKNAVSSEEANLECRNLVDSNIRPVLIDLNEKILKDRKNWFYKILSPVGDSLKFLVGNPKLTNLDLLTASMSLATDVGVDYLNHKRKLNQLKDEAGLTYLIKLGKTIK